MRLEEIKVPLRRLRDAVRDWRARAYIDGRMRAISTKRRAESSQTSCKRRVAAFVESMRMDDEGVRYRFSASCSQPTLYASVYACMTLSMLGDLEKDFGRKGKWLAYFDSFQNPEDGLFYDPAVSDANYCDGDWWGARHLALHMIAAYSDLGGRPKYKFGFLSRYCEVGAIEKWLHGYDWRSSRIGDGDLDNKIMNIGGLLQYQRDVWGDDRAGEAVGSLKRVLLSKRNDATGMWGGFDPNVPDQRSRMVQFAYHLFSLFFYDGFYSFDIEKVVRAALATRNEYGGYGTRPNASACEDIDTLDILIRLSYELPESADLLSCVHAAIEHSYSWILLNQVDDGGFVFRLNERLQYGHTHMSSAVNEGAMFPTWFRLLSIALIDAWRGNESFRIQRAPGYFVGFPERCVGDV